MPGNRTSNDEPHWYVIHTKPRQEERADDNLRAWNVETLLPLYRTRLRSRYTNGFKYRVQPLFPRYIFARFDAGRLLHKIRYTRGIHAVVSFGGEPSQVDDEIIATIKSRIGGDGLVKIEDKFKAGDKVKINDDILGTLDGVFMEGVGGTERVRILLSTINYQAHIEVHRNLVKLANT